MMTPTTAQELRARLRPRHAALRAMGPFYESSDIERAWWPTETEDPVGVCWLRASSPPRTGGVDPRTIRLRDAAEALVLLNALAQVDHTEWVREVRDVWSPRSATRPIASRNDSMGRVVMGINYCMFRSKALAPISERVAGLEEPTPQFLEDIAWLKEHAPSAMGLCGWRPIPVQMSLSLDEDDALGLAFVLRQIVQNVATQQAFSQVYKGREPSTVETAATCSRFEIVDVLSDEGSSPTANLEALECIVRLVKRGVRVHRLPTICIDTASGSIPLSVMKCLHVLLPPQRDPAVTSTIHQAYVTDDTSLHLIPALFTSVIACQAAIELEIQVHRHLADENEFPSSTSMWKWTAYTLFSRHAAHHVTEVTLHVDTLDPRALRVIEEVLAVENPISGLFENVVDGDEWMDASEFYVDSPGTSPSENAPVFRSVEPWHVRVLRSLEAGQLGWRKILLPGYGKAWAKPVETINFSAHGLELAADLTDSPKSQPALHLVLEGLDSDNKDHTISLLRLVHRDVASIELEYVDRIFTDFDMTEWAVDLLRIAPALEQLKLPAYALIQRPLIFVEAAEAGQCRLRSLSLQGAVDVASSGIIEFLEVLCDATHPFTQQLKYLHFGVRANEALPPELVAAWSRVLQCNRTLHTISITVRGPECVDADFNEQVVIRTGPLSISSKLAFLSVTYDLRASHTTSYSARSRLDTSVLATIFAFAASHRIRKISIEHYAL